MSSSLATGFLAAIREGEAYIPIQVSSLRLDLVTGFDIYLEPRPGDPMVLYARRNVKFTEDARKRLEDNRVDTVHIDAQQENLYRLYLERNLPYLLEDPKLSVADKSELLYTSAQGLVRDVIDDPEVEGGVTRSKDLVQHTVELLMAERTSLRHLIETASFDYYSYTHSVNVCVYSVALANRVGVSTDRVLKDFGNGVLLRDVGLSQIDPAIVRHRGKLSPEQYEEMKQHPVLGEDILSSLGGLSENALDVVRHHHEKLNGKGYPDGLTGNENRPLVRICTIADIFDALTTSRTHKKAVKSFDALQMMGNELRHEVDQDYLKAFIEMMGNPEA